MDSNGKKLKDNNSEAELDKLILECMNLQAILQVNIETLLKSVDEVSLRHDHNSSKRRGNSKTKSADNS